MEEALGDKEEKPNSDKPNYSDPVEEHEYQKLNRSRLDLEQARADVTSGRGPKILSRNSTSQKVLRYSGLGIQMGLFMVLPALLGYLADREWGTSPFGVIGGTFFGLTAAMYTVISFVNRTESSVKREKGASDGSSSGLSDDRLKEDA